MKISIENCKRRKKQSCINIVSSVLNIGWAWTDKKELKIVKRNENLLQRENRFSVHFMQLINFRNTYNARHRHTWNTIQIFLSLAVCQCNTLNLLVCGREHNEMLVSLYVFSATNVAVDANNVINNFWTWCAFLNCFLVKTL